MSHWALRNCENIFHHFFLTINSENIGQIAASENDHKSPLHCMLNVFFLCGEGTIWFYMCCP